MTWSMDEVRTGLSFQSRLHPHQATAMHATPARRLAVMLNNRYRVASMRQRQSALRRWHLLPFHEMQIEKMFMGPMT